MRRFWAGTSAGLLCACLAVRVCAQQLPAAVTTDPVADARFPAGMEALTIPSHGANMNALLYTAAGAGPHPAVLLLHGFPGNEQNLDLAQAIRRAGWNVLTLHYRGSWGSPGAFSFAHTLEDAQAAVAMLRDPEQARRFRVDSRRIVVIGHSMGGFIAAYTAAHDRAIAGVGLISAWNIGADAARKAGDGEDKEAAAIAAEVIPLAGCTAVGLVRETRQHTRDWNFDEYAGALTPRPVLVVEAEDGSRPDSHALVERLARAGDTRVREVYWKTDHPYSDHRIALEAAVVRWLDGIGASPAERVASSAGH